MSYSIAVPVPIAVIKQEQTTCSITFDFRLQRSPGIIEFNSPLFDNFGVEWQFFLRKTQAVTYTTTEVSRKKSISSTKTTDRTTGTATTFVLSSQWRCNDRNLQQTVISVAVSLKRSVVEDYNTPKLTKFNLAPSSLVEYEIGRWSDLGLYGVVSLSLTVTILEEPSKEGSQASAVSAHSVDSQSMPTASATSPPALGSSITQAAMLTLARSLNNGAFFNTKFIACSRRTTSKGPGATQVVYAQSTVLEAVSPNLALDNMAAREDELFLGDSTTPGERAIEIVEDYEYDSDSDLDDDEDNDNDVEPKATIPPPTVVNTEGEQDASSKSGEDSLGQPGAVAMSVSEGMSPGNGMTAGDPERCPTSGVEAECAIGAAGAENFATSVSDLEETHIQNQYSVAAIPIEPPTNIANVVYVKGTAQKTWRALIHYCYTGHVSFLPLKSSRAVSGRISQDEEDLRCSPKSMYRLAHRLDIIALKNTAIAVIEEHLSEANVLAELFSKFTSRYPAVQAVETKVLLKNRAKPEVIEGLPKITRKIFQGQMPHAETVLSDVMQKVFQH